MLQSINWIHISDLHLRENQKWSQDVILTSILESIEERVRIGDSFDFILISGDLTFSGNKEEFKLFVDFLQKLTQLTGVEIERVFCIPGNHDIERKRQKTCFKGARQILSSQNEVDAFLTDEEEINTLLLRLGNYNAFIDNIYGKQDKTYIGCDKLGYVSTISISGINVAIVGLNSAWLANGGPEDHLNLLVGEKQLIDAIAVVKNTNPNIVVAMVHHPLHLLQEFDRTQVENGLMEHVQFLHTGHLHTPDQKEIRKNGFQLIEIAAGASYESRTSRNSFNLVALDLTASRSTRRTMLFEPAHRKFIHKEPDEVNPIAFPFAKKIEIRQLAEAITSNFSSLSSIKFYLSSLLLDHKNEYLIKINNDYSSGSFELLQDQDDSVLKSKTIAFRGCQTFIKLLGRNKSLTDILQQHGKGLDEYGSYLNQIAAVNADVSSFLLYQEKLASTLALTRSGEPFHHTILLLEELKRAEDYDMLKAQSIKHLDSSAVELALLANKCYLLSLAHSGITSDLHEALRRLTVLVENGQADAEDLALMISILINLNETSRAKDILFSAADKFPSHYSAFQVFAAEIISRTGDHEFRKAFSKIMKR